MHSSEITIPSMGNHDQVASTVQNDLIGSLFRDHAPFLLRVVERFCGAGPHVEDVVQEVFILAHRKRAALPTDSPSLLRGWLYRAAMNMVQHHRRSTARRLGLLERLWDSRVESPIEPSPQTIALLGEQAARIHACVCAMPRKQAEVFVLYELEELGGKEISALLEIPQNTVWSRLSHARERFKKQWSAQNVSEDAGAGS